MALDEWKLRLTSAKVEVEVEAELGNNLGLFVRRETFHEKFVSIFVEPMKKICSSA